MSSSDGAPVGLRVRIDVLALVGLAAVPAGDLSTITATEPRRAGSRRRSTGRTAGRARSPTREAPG